ncbi:MAG: CSLREA domain-containing protein, partial [Anaerolinea sp.]|nr:CSLREA domain-containing protein [Anaerolinea sp.]
MKSYPFVRTGLIVLTLIALLLTAAPQSARAAGLITVTSAADSVGSDGLCTLREAIANANNDAATYGDCAAGSGADTITFAPALAGGIISLTTIGDTTLGPTALGITSNITILGDANDGLTIERSGSAPDMRLFYVSAGGNLTLKYLTLQGGLARGFAGGTAFNGGTGGGAAGVGGAIFNRGSVTLDSVTLLNNQAIGGNGGDNVDGSNWLYSGSGGSGLGGGIFNRSAMLTLLNVTLANNAVSAGAAGSANDPGANGGRDGSEIYVYGSASVVNTTNSIAANNSSAYNHFVNDGGTVNGSHNLVMRASGVPAEVILSAADPLLELLGDNGGATFTFALEAGSPAVNAGTGSGAPVLDQRGAGRDEMPDIGAYEVMGGEWLVDSAADTVANDGQTTLREAVQM